MWLNMYNVLLLISSENLIVELQSLKLSEHSVFQLVNSKMLITELQNLMLNEKTVYVVIESVLLHIGIVLGLQKVSNKGRAIPMMQLGNDIQLGNLCMIGRGQLLIILGKVYILAH